MVDSNSARCQRADLENIFISTNMLLGVNPYQARGTQTHAQLLAVHDRLSIAREYDMRGYDLTTSPNLSPTSAPNLGSNPNVTPTPTFAGGGCCRCWGGVA